MAHELVLEEIEAVAVRKLLEETCWVTDREMENLFHDIRDGVTLELSEEIARNLYYSIIKNQHKTISSSLRSVLGEVVVKFRDELDGVADHVLTGIEAGGFNSIYGMDSQGLHHITYREIEYHDVEFYNCSCGVWEMRREVAEAHVKIKKGIIGYSDLSDSVFQSLVRAESTECNVVERFKHSFTWFLLVETVEGDKAIVKTEYNVGDKVFLHNEEGKIIGDVTVDLPNGSFIGEKIDFEDLPENVKNNFAAETL